LRDIILQLDPLQLLEEIRAIQHQIVRLANGGQPYTPTSTKDDLSRFLANLSTVWRKGEVRPTHTSVTRPPRHWRTRPDPFESEWPMVRQWLEIDPDQTAVELFERLQRETPRQFHNGQLRTLQRRLKQWRGTMARHLVFGAHDVTKSVIAGFSH
jgi:hypothetical protein